MKPNFSICLITKNEEFTLPRLLDSLKEFRDRGGDIVVVDTGSTDQTAQVARNYGCTVDEVGPKFIKTIEENLAANVNGFFIVNNELPLVKAGDKYFHFAEARNYVATLASNYMILSLDADEIITALNIDAINYAILEGYTKFEHVQVFTHEPDGSEGVKFIQSKFYDRRVCSWNGPVHEMLSDSDHKTYLDETILKIEHFQNTESNRSIYPIGLAVDCFLNQDKDRNCHYLARELFWSQRTHSAEKEFKRHLSMVLPPQEYPTTPTHMESMLFLGNILGLHGDLDGELAMYHKAMEAEPTRREPLIRFAQYYKWYGRIPEAREWAEKALQFKWEEKYGASERAFYNEPKEIIDWAAKEYPIVTIVVPTLGREEKLGQLLDSIRENAGYENYELIVKYDQFPPNNTGVPKLVKQAVDESKGDLVMYLGNDCIMRKDCLKNAVKAMKDNFPDYSGLIALNDGYWYGEVATHWLAGKNLIPLVGGELFHTGYFHTGCDSELSQMARKLNKYFWAEDARIYHDHPIQPTFKGEVDNVYKLAYNEERRAHDNQLYHERAALLGFEFVENFQNPLFIPRKVFSIWLNDKGIPEDVMNNIETAKMDGFEHVLITLDNCNRESKYVQDCLSRNDVKGWVKASDYLRMWYLYNEGGIYIDAATDVLKPFGLELLSCHLFGCREDNGFFANGIIGVEPHHPVIKKCLDRMDTLDGKSDQVFENGMMVWTEELDAHFGHNWTFDNRRIMRPTLDPQQACLYPMEYFLPYNHQTGITNITENSYTCHRYLKSWI